ncbi:unnamed protein product [Brachionus calyciflorus]|uniref:Uncharacterized protein n=1 Tax=Brachionus calyciflorus TaxID=104777 RepID=A0A814MDN1_9BILA|nr:unnamed protein product [Brachionus calyciflorus]
MNSEEEIFNYYSKLINEIDLQSETRLLSLDLNSENDKIVDDLTNLRLSMINRSREIEKHNVEGTSNKIAVFIPKDDELIHTNERISQSTYFKNMIGKFFILGEKLSDDLISKLSDVLNRKIRKFQRSTFDFANLQDELKFWIILDLLRHSDSQTDLFDLTNSFNNKLINLYFSSRKFPVINEYDLDFLVDYINLDEVSKITYDFPCLMNTNNFNRFKNLTSLGISAEIDHLSYGLFYGLENLEILKLIKCKIKTIDEFAFDNLEKLIYLNLNDNSLETLETNIFYNLSRLEKLYVKHNEITQIEIDTFLWCPNLKELDLSLNKLFCLDTDVFSIMNNLKLLRMDYNIPKKRKIRFENEMMNFYFINQLTDLVSLTISDFYDNFIDIQIENLRHLVIKIPEVPEFRENFQNLLILTLINVEIFPEGCFYNLISLKMLKIILRNKQIIREIDDQHFSGLEDLGYFLIEVNDPDPYWLQTNQDLFNKMFKNNISSKLTTTSSSSKIEILNCESEKSLKRRLLDYYLEG